MGARSLRILGIKYFTNGKRRTESHDMFFLREYGEDILFHTKKFNKKTYEIFVFFIEINK